MRSPNSLPSFTESPANDKGGASIGHNTSTIRTNIFETTTLKPVNEKTMVWDLAVEAPPIDDPFLQWIESLHPSLAERCIGYLARRSTARDIATDDDRTALEMGFEHFCRRHLQHPFPDSPALIATIIRNVLDEKKRATYLRALETQNLKQTAELTIHQHTEKTEKRDMIAKQSRTELLYRVHALASETIHDSVRSHREGGDHTSPHASLLLQGRALAVADALKDYCDKVTVVARNGNDVETLKQQADPSWKVINRNDAPTEQQDIIVIDQLDADSVTRDDALAGLQQAITQLKTDGILFLARPAAGVDTLLYPEYAKRNGESVQRPIAFLTQNGFDVQTLHPALELCAIEPASLASLATIVEAHLPEERRISDLLPLIGLLEETAKSNDGIFRYPLSILMAQRSTVAADASSTTNTVHAKKSPPAVSPAVAYAKTIIRPLPAAPTTKELSDFLIAVTDNVTLKLTKLTRENIVLHLGGGMTFKNFELYLQHEKRIHRTAKNTIVGNASCGTPESWAAQGPPDKIFQFAQDRPSGIRSRTPLLPPGEIGKNTQASIERLFAQIDTPQSGPTTHAFKSEVNDALKLLQQAGATEMRATLITKLQRRFGDKIEWIPKLSAAGSQTSQQELQDPEDEAREYDTLRAFMDALPEKGPERNKDLSTTDRQKIIRFAQLHKKKGTKDLCVVMKNYGISMKTIRGWPLAKKYR